MSLNILKLSTVNYKSLCIKFTVDSKRDEEVFYTVFRGLISLHFSVESSFGLDDSPLDLKKKNTMHEVLYEVGGTINHGMIVTSKSKFKVSETVEVDGNGTGIGDVTGHVLSIELCDISGQFHYHIKVDGQSSETVYVAEKFIKPIKN